MANISISLNLKAYKGFKYLVDKDENGKKVYYAAIPVTELFNPSGTKDIYATAVMVPTPNSQYSDFMIKPMLSAKELQTKTPEELRALPKLGTGKYMQRAVSKDLMQDAEKAKEVDESIALPAGVDPFAQQEQLPPVPFAQPQVVDPRSMPDTANTIYYLMEGNQFIYKTATLVDAMNAAQSYISPTIEVTRYEGSKVMAKWNKIDFLAILTH